MVERQKIIDQLKEELEKEEDVVAFALVGSQARETVYKATPHSDMEAYVVVRDEAVEEFGKKLPEIVGRLGQVIFSYKNQFSGFSAVYEDLFRLELPLTKESDLASIFSRPKAQTVKPLIDRTEGKLDQVLAKRPESLDFGEKFNYWVIDFWYMAILTVQYFKKGEIWNSRSAFHTLGSNLIKLLELRKDPEILLLETNKRIENFLNDDLEILKHVSPAYDESQIREAIIRILDIFPDVAKEVAKQNDYNYPNQIEDQVKPKLLELLGL